MSPRWESLRFGNLHPPNLPTALDMGLSYVGTSHQICDSERPATASRFAIRVTDDFSSRQAVDTQL